MSSRPTSAPARTHSASTVVAATPAAVYALVSDVTRTGEHSDVVVGCWWDAPPGPQGPQPGDRFTGRNQTPERTWETRCTVEEAVPGRRFSWLVGEGLVRWTYELELVEGGTRLTERWEFLEDGIRVFGERYGERAGEEVEQRTQAAHRGMPRTLEALRTALEQQPG